MQMVTHEMMQVVACMVHVVTHAVTHVVTHAVMHAVTRVVTRTCAVLRISEMFDPQILSLKLRAIWELNDSRDSPMTARKEL